jgi:arginyl-tRNA synthetase
LEAPFDSASARELDPLRSALAQKIYKTLSGHFKVEDITEVEIFRMIERPPESVLGDFAFPCFRLAKSLRKSPITIAETLSTLLKEGSLDTWIQDIKAVGAFLNVFVDKSHLAESLLPKMISGAFFSPQITRAQHSKKRVMIEFSQPNTHKEFHVGHARNVCLGDSLCRLFQYLGYDLISANYLGDEGTHVAKCLWQVLEEGDGAPSDEMNKAHWYGQRYVEATRRLKEANPTDKAAYEKKISTILADLEAKRGRTYEVFKKSRLECIADFKKIYAWMDVHFDHYFFESEVSEEAQSIVDEFLAKGLFKESQGAIGIDMSEDKLGFFMARKSDGSTPYITKDLALARRKFEDFQVDTSIYVVGSEQNFHFQQLFKALELMGFEKAKNCFHLSYAHVKLPEGKMSSRSGNVLSFAFLRDNLLKELAPYLSKYETQWTEFERTQTADQLAVGSIKYGMLSSDPMKEIVFDLSAWTSFEGNTGPYLMYSYARTRSILAKSKEQGIERSFDHLKLIQDVHAHELLIFLYDFNDTVKQSCEHYKPSILANYLYNMCKSFNRFYVEVPILKSQSEDKRGALLSLLEAFSITLKKGLTLLGITPPERM